jgi:hypothetical protein
MTTPTLREAAPTDAQLDALWSDACQRDQPTRDMVRAFARAAIAAAPPQQPTETFDEWHADWVQRLGQPPTALDAWNAGAHPQQSARVPLTPERVTDLMTDAGYNRADSAARCDFIAGLRHGEAAHGIVPAPTTDKEQP